MYRGGEAATAWCQMLLLLTSLKRYFSVSLFSLFIERKRKLVVVAAIYYVNLIFITSDTRLVPAFKEACLIRCSREKLEK